jgi:transcriptional regulator with XRE-family HTH domain
MERIDPDRVRKQRKALGLSQKKVAKRIEEAGFGELNYQSIGQLEAGDVENPSYARYLPSALQTTWEYLTGRTDNPSGVSDSAPNEPLNFLGSNGAAHPRTGAGQEGPYMLTEISRMLGQMEGRMEARFDARFDKIDRKLEDHERRLEVLEERPFSGPQKGRRR